MEVSRVGQYSVQICSYVLDLSAVGAESLPSIESAAKFLMRIPLCSKNGSILELYRRDMGRAMNSGTARPAGRLSTCANLIQVLAHVHDTQIEIAEGPQRPSANAGRQPATSCWPIALMINSLR